MIIKRKPLIRLFLCVSLIGSGLIINNARYMTLNEKEEMFRQSNLNQIKLLELKQQQEFNKSIEDKRNEIVKYLNSDEYAEREFINSLKKKTGLNVTGYTKVEFVKTFYTSLPSENGGYTVTCNGKPLKGNIVANNIIPQYTNILLGDRLVKVGDRGAKSHFDVMHRLDVLVERIPGESDNTYLKRVNNLGIQREVGYILNVE